MSLTTMRFGAGLRLHIRIVARIRRTAGREAVALDILEIRIPKDEDILATILDLPTIQVQPL
jgi:hypothetical protein